ncbi:conserved oligomeric Golgi complex subunit 5 [Procambarus clarkii]|uniref:conserved oligomeric Golgi complex subunit 5 n=1 Tax=Procambarus clarkii TaxID=6728 RepID=UPI001E671A24|nr:conserved oligomeric Golgi complex subunit 5-like [Procambarus clarkii]XP_045618168.1 conserved oligomeric Golgi complex subunit 5-like [Procambarus clarkii]XP_045618174.1 conserved oligomeric Golgi complex subunit 5-like [Procambarus clarkii]XP_045618181.1 conserved oligomeric Golgi complex subunit 5-like [Procambarus clarkii]XP_045618189.1 conserved oligomeric Golgi complex subunit 5-like [Procambarus clarkii]XP_045618197.1 conserved oligomeric Golgi complex subunit 5-like [Procambarus cl
MSSTIFKEFQEDGTYAPFLADDFDVQSHASQLVQGVIIAEQLNKLTLGINRLEREIESQVGSHYEDLLSQATGVETLEDVLNTMHTRIQTLLAGVERLRVRVVDPYQRVERHTLVLGRLQATCELLRRVIRCLMLSQRLQQQLSSEPRDITKAAISLSELDHLGRDVDLTGLDVLERDQRLVRQARSDVEKQAVVMMDRGMELQNQTQVGTALQVFHNLGILVTSVEKVLDSLIGRLNKSVSLTLDVNALLQMSQDTRKSGPGKAIMPGPGQSVQFRASLWSNLEKLMDDIYHACVQTSHLHKVLAKKRDPVTHVCFLEEVQRHGKSDLFTRVWRNITRILTVEFAKAAQDSTFIRQYLEVDYPKLIRLYGDLWRRLEGISMEMRSVNTDVTSALDESVENRDEVDKMDKHTQEFDPEQALRGTLVPLEEAYLSRSRSRLLDPVNLMFAAQDAPPAKEEVDALIKTITSELNVSAVDKSLSETVAKNVAESLQLFCVKCKQLVVTSADATQVIGSPTPAQVLNGEVVNQLLYVRSQVERTASATLAHLPQPVTNMLLKALPSIDMLMSSAVQPLFTSITDAIEDIILTVHSEDFSGGDSKGADSQCSLYMRELQGFITRAAEDYLSIYQPSRIIKEKIHTLACRCLDLFVRHASLLRPIGEGGKLRLAADFAQMEMAISPLCNRPSELGRAYRVVRSFRPLLFQTVEHIIASPSIGDVIPYSTVLHFLFAKAPSELRSPHQTAGWSVSRYSDWLDEHQNERERLQLVRGALEAYVANVRSRHLTQFASVYPSMLKLLEKGMAAHGLAATS